MECPANEAAGLFLRPVWICHCMDASESEHEAAIASISRNILEDPLSFDPENHSVRFCRSDQNGQTTEAQRTTYRCQGTSRL